jgi:hypothetical protein
LSQKFCNFSFPGVLCKSHIRCATHGSAYNLRTGLLEFGVGLNSIWTFKVRHTKAYFTHSSQFPHFQVHAVESVLFADVSAQKPKAVRLGPEPPPLLRSPASVHKSPIVVVGAGIAGLTCVETLRQLGYTGPILMISRERELPYDRKSLSKVGGGRGNKEQSAMSVFCDKHKVDFLSDFQTIVYQYLYFVLLFTYSNSNSFTNLHFSLYCIFHPNSIL